MVEILRSPRKRVIQVAVFAGLVIAIVWLVQTANSPWVPSVRRSAIPPPVIVKLGSTNVHMRISQFGALFVLPDGSLWRWGWAGGNGFSRASVPEQVGTNQDWMEAWAANGQCIGLRRDGSIWHWGTDFAAPLVSPTPFNAFLSSPEPLGSQHDWVSVTTGDQHSIALKRDGTLWGWGHDELGQLGNGLGFKETNKVRLGQFRVHPIQTNLVQVGTNRDWVAITCAQGSDTIGLRSNGTLWVWGRVNRFLGNQAAAIFPVPTQICRETNWVAVEGGLGFNGKREAWYLLQAPPDASAPAATTCRLLATDCSPGRFAIAGAALYKLRSDATLWTAGLSWQAGVGFNIPKDLPWRRVGDRSDWVSLQGMATAFGLTSDGILWVWGADQGQEGVMPLSLKIRLMEERLMTRLGLQVANTHTAGWITPVQETPRPLARMIFPGTTQGRTP